MSPRVPEMKGICATGGHSFLSMYHVPLVEFMCLVLTRMLGPSYHMRLRSFVSVFV